LRNTGLEQCFLTFFGPQHPVIFKNKFGGTLTWQKRQLGAPLLVVKNLKSYYIQYLVAPLTPLHGTQVGNHMSRALNQSLKSQNWFSSITYAKY
jgi:hypothetical protein